MKEAAGEANMTVITIVLIAIVLGIGTIVVTSMMGNVGKKTACQDLGGELTGSTCTYKTNAGANATCTVTKCGDGSYACTPRTTCS